MSFCKVKMLLELLKVPVQVLELLEALALLETPVLILFESKVLNVLDTSAGIRKTF